MKKVLLLLFAMSTLSNCWLFSPPPAVKYEVTGTASLVDIIYQDESGTNQAVSGATLPWSHSFTGKNGARVEITASNRDSTGSVTVTIYENDAVFQTSTSSDAYAIVNAYGYL
jgi:hypothetical protein